VEWFPLLIAALAAVLALGGAKFVLGGGSSFSYVK